jgi:hypothetical protein
MHRLGVVRARLKIQHNLLDRQAGVLLTALLHADTLSACEAGAWQRHACAWLLHVTPITRQLLAGNDAQVL